MNPDPKPPQDPSPESASVRVCPECHAGLYHLQYLTYFTWLNEELVTVPNFPAWVCDVCGRREYDPRAVSWLNTLLSPSAGRRKTTRRNTRSRPRPMDRPQP
ncbi:MAG TPA: YgiT-type zinc finger protein [Anaerolineales bacterium]|nr:YgiT-type zinc finger protein [Anaerolineales bacterium]